MADNIEKDALRVQRVLWGKESENKQGLVLAFLGLDDKQYSVLLEYPAVIGTLANIIQVLPKLSIPQSEVTPILQGFDVLGIQTAMKDDGSVALILELKGGAELPLVVEPSGLRALADELQQFAQLADPPVKRH